MKTRLLAMGFAVISAGLVACGGGGGGGITPSGTPTPVPTATPTPTPTPISNPYGCVGQAPFSAARTTTANAPRPIAPGDSFTYTGSYARTFAKSSPCPQPTATTNASVGVTVTDSSAASPAGATNQQSVETDAFPTQTTTTTTDATLGTQNSTVVLYQTSSSDATGNRITTAYTVPQIIDDNGAGTSWSNANPAGTLTEALADGTAVNRTIDADGSYVDTETFADGSTAKITVNGTTGAGTYALAGLTFSYAAPTGPPPSGTITLNIVGAKIARTFPAWFTPGSNWVHDDFTDTATSSFDPACTNVPSQIASITPYHKVTETYSVTDPVLGYIETRTTSSYDVDGFGPACVTIADVVDSYYDYQNDMNKIDYQSQNGQPNSVDTIEETLTMTAPTTPYPASTGGRRPAAAAKSAPVTARFVAQRIAAIDHQRALERAQRARALHDFAVRIMRKGEVR